MKGGGKILLYLNALRWMLYRFFHDSYLMLVILLIIDLSIVFQVTTSNAISIFFFFFFFFFISNGRFKDGTTKTTDTGAVTLPL